MPGAIKNTADIDSKVLAEICSNLAHNSFITSAIYAFLYGLLCTLTSIYDDFPLITWTFGSLIFLVGVARLTLSYWFKRIHQKYHAVWLKIFFGVVIAGSSAWGLFTYLILNAYGPSQNTVILLFVIAGVSSGSFLTLAPSFHMITAHLVLVLGPLLLAFAQLDTPESPAYQIFTMIYLTYLVTQAHKISVTVNNDLRNKQIITNQNAELEHANLMANQAQLAKEQFMANISHEIRTPLNGVISAADLLLESDLNPEHRHYVEIIQNSGTVLLRLINDVLDIAKIQAGKMQYEKVPFSLHQLVEAQTGLLAVKAHEKKLALNTLTSPSLPPFLIGDPWRVSQVLLNLVSNAIKFTSEGSITVRAINGTLQPDAKNINIRFEVEDTGIGIAPEHVSKLFEPFMQVDGSASRQFGGTGLGLAISKKLVEDMGGKVGVSSIPGMGSTFWFELPFSIATGSATQNEKPKSLKPDKEFHILVADDVLTNQMLTARLLTKIGYKPHCVTNGREALEAIEQGHFDLILMDCQMPEMDGFETTQKIRAHISDRIKDIPIIALTANAMPGDKEKCLQVGMNDYLSKPLKKEMLAETLAKWLLQSVSIRAS